MWRLMCKNDDLSKGTRPVTYMLDFNQLICFILLNILGKYYSHHFNDEETKV